MYNLTFYLHMAYDFGTLRVYAPCVDMLVGGKELRAVLVRPGTRQFIKFALVGFASLAVEYSLLAYLMYAMRVDYLLATTVSFVASIVFNYALSMKYVFERKDDMSRRREFTIFAILAAVGLGLNDLYMFVGVGLLNIGTMVMKPISTFFVTWYNFFSRRRFLDAGRQ